MLRELQGRKLNLASSFVHSAVSLYPRLSKTKNCAGRLEISVKLGCQGFLYREERNHLKTFN